MALAKSDDQEGLSEFSSSLCDCFTHMPSCCHACWCGQVVLGQLFEKVAGPKFMCIFIVVIVHMAGIIAAGFNNEYQVVSVGGMGPATALESSLIFGILWVLLHKVYKMYKIKHPGYLCVACQLVWCVPCKLCQLARHVHDYARNPEKQPCCDYSATGSKSGKECCDCSAGAEDYAWEKQEEGGGPSDSLLDAELDNADVEASVVSQPAV